MTPLHEHMSLETDDLREILEVLVDNQNWPGIVEAVYGVPTPEVADAFIDLEKTSRVLAFRAFPRQLQADIFAYLDIDRANRLLENLTDEEARELVANIKPDDRTQMLAELPGQVTQRLLNLLNPTDLREARQLLGYPVQSTGRLMTPDYVAVRPTWTIREALDHIRKKGVNSEIISVIYVTTSDWKLIDSLPLRELILADLDDTVQSLMDESFVCISAFADREEAVRVLARYDLVALPVVDSDGILLGIVTVDDVLDVAEEEATEDFYKSAAVAPLERKYSNSPIISLFRARVGWLLVLVGVNLISASIIASYEATLEQIAALVLFMPLLIGSGGNTGSQSATFMVRAIATGDLNLRQWFPTAIKESAVGLILGLTLGIASCVVGFFLADLMVGLIVGLSMLAIILVTNLLGTLLPFILTRFGVDPAVASSPLVTTIADSTGLVIYFTIATLFLSQGWVSPI